MCCFQGYFPPTLLPLQSMYFESIPDIVRALHAIARDPAVLLARIVNRLHRDYDATSTAGYRDIMINLVRGCLPFPVELHACPASKLHRTIYFAQLHINICIAHAVPTEQCTNTLSD